MLADFQICISVPLSLGRMSVRNNITPKNVHCEAAFVGHNSIFLPDIVQCLVLELTRTTTIKF